MTAPVCPLDGKPIHDQASICGACSSDLRQALAELPGLLDDLDLTLSRQTAQGQRHGGRSSEKALPYDVRASDTADAARVVLVGWVNVLHAEPKPCEVYFCPQSGEVECPTHGGFDTCCLHPERHEPRDPETHDTDPMPANTLRAMAEWLFARVDRARRHEAGAEIAVEIRDLSKAIRRATDRRGVERVYAGLCGAVHEGGSQECPNPLYARVDATSIRCATCGAVHDVQERREWMRGQAAEMVLNATEAAHAVSALWGKATVHDDGAVTWERVTPAAVRGMARWGRIIAHAHDTRTEREIPLYRVGDVIAELVRRDVAEQTRRSVA